MSEPSFMKPVYGDKAVNVTPAQLDDKALLAIARLVRACAELEDIVNLFICNLAEISESRMVVLLGKSAISKRVEIAEYLAKMGTKTAQELATWAFNEGFWNTFRCRNDVAHGVLLGKNEEEAWSFLTAKTETPEGPSAIQIVASYETSFLEIMATTAEEAIPQLEERLKLKDQRAARHGRPLAPHRKAQRRSQRDAKQPQPQKPSRTK